MMLIIIWKKQDDRFRVDHDKEFCTTPPPM
jgi:hypothetical protein